METKKTIMLWTDQPITEAQNNLLVAVINAHGASAFRPNNSTNAVSNVAFAGGTYENALASALLSLGKTHGPVAAVQELFTSDDPQERVLCLLAAGKKVPGWGNSFEKGHADPIWAPVEEILLRDFPGHHQQVMDLTDIINIATKRNLFPNPAAYTAIANIIIGIPKEAASWMLWTGRGISWTKIYLHQLAVANAPNVSKHQPEPEPVHERDSES